MVANCLAETKIRLKNASPQRVQDIRDLDYPVVGFSSKMVEIDRSLKDFLFEFMYRHKKVKVMTSEADRVVCDLFDVFINDPTKLPDEWQAKTDVPGSEITAHAAADYIAGMTDRFALEEHAKLIEGGVMTR